MAVIQERDVRVDIGTATAASRDYLILDNRDIIVVVVERAVGLDNQGERKLRLLQDGVGAWDGVEGRTDVSRGGVGVRRRGNT